MPVTSVIKDEQALTLTIHAEFSVQVSRLWDAYLDPRQIEKFWGPVGFPATFTRHDAIPGGRTNYYMTSPEGEQFHGYWLWTQVVDHKFFEITDGFADAQGNPDTAMPTTRVVFSFDPTATGSKLSVSSHFDSIQDLEKLLAMGLDEGMSSAMSQIEQVLSDLREYSSSYKAEGHILSDTTVRISRLVRGSQENVWRAFHEPELIQRWMLGPEGWKMTDCQVPSTPGETYRFWWEPEPGTDGQAFGFTGEFLSFIPQGYESLTQRMIDSDYPQTLIEHTFTSISGGTLLNTVITYPDATTRDAVLGTGMIDGMEASYHRLESLL